LSILVEETLVRPNERGIPERNLDALIDAKVNQRIATLLMELAQRLGADPDRYREQQQWYDTDPAYKLLGFGTAKSLRELVSSGDLRLGKEVRNRQKKGAKIPRYQFHVEKCQQRLTELPERRK
jgi:hypothetical protein